MDEQKKIDNFFTIGVVALFLSGLGIGVAISHPPNQIFSWVGWLLCFSAFVLYCVLVRKINKANYVVELVKKEIEVTKCSQ